MVLKHLPCHRAGRDSALFRGSKSYDQRVGMEEPSQEPSGKDIL